MLALSSFHCQASHPTVGVRLPGAGGVEVVQMCESVEVWRLLQWGLTRTMTTWAVGVMRAVSTQWQGATRRIGNSLGSEPYIHTACPEHYDGNWLARLGITTVMIWTRHVVMCVLRRPRGHWLKVSSPLFFSHPPSIGEPC